MISNTDAVLTNIDSCRINKNCLKDIKFEDADKVTLLFLLHGNEPNGLEEVQNSLQQSNNNQHFWLQHLTTKRNWENWLLEALILTQNVAILQKQFGYTIKEINRFKNFRRVPTNHVNGTLRNLYLMCEYMDCQMESELLRKMYCSVTQPDFEFLEYHVLYWMKMRFIQICENQKKENFTKLLRVLKTMGLDKTPFYLDLSALNGSLTFDNTGQKESIEIKDRQSACKPENETVNLKEFLMSSEGEYWSLSDSEGLCVIINMESYFTKLPRIGSQKDVDSLKRTFRGCNFDGVVFKNLTSECFIKTLNKIPKVCKNRYKCIVITILSHGNKDGIICFDDFSVSYGDIREMFCQPELKNVYKILLLQCCRGKYFDINEDINCETLRAIKGLPDENNDLCYKDITNYEQFVVYASTLDDFVSGRDENLGTQFIQSFCEVMQSEDDNRSLINISQTVAKKLGEGRNLIKQSPEIQISGILEYNFPLFSKHFGTS